MLLPFDLLLTCHSVHLVKDNKHRAVDLTTCGCCYCPAVRDLDMCVCVCSGCVMQCGMLLVATAFYLHNKPLLRMSSEWHCLLTEKEDNNRSAYWRSDWAACFFLLILFWMLLWRLALNYLHVWELCPLFHVKCVSSILLVLHTMFSCVITRSRLTLCRWFLSSIR
jgi:hypothetical protein